MPFIFEKKNRAYFKYKRYTTVDDGVFCFTIIVASGFHAMPRRLVIITCGNINGGGHSLNAFNETRR